MKNAIIIGGSGQDGILLNKYLKSKKYKTYSIENPENKKNSKINILKKQTLKKLFRNLYDPEVYYLAAYHQSSEQNQNINSPSDLFRNSLNTHVVGLLNVLTTIYEENRNSKLFYASSSLIFSGNNGKYQNEKTFFDPVGAYGITKATGNMIIKEFRDKYGLHCLSGILYNHESGLRKENFLTRRIIETAIRISKGSNEKCEVSDLEAVVDWGLASDYVKIFHKVLQIKKPEDFIIASGKTFKVKLFIKEVFSFFNLNWKDHVVETKSELFRKSNPRCGDIKKLKKYVKNLPKHSISEFVYLLVLDVIRKNHKIKTNLNKR